MKLMGRKPSVGAVVAAALMLPWIGMIVPASAHHAFAAEYDAKKHVILKGTVTKMEWINPHAWSFTRDSLKPGTEITVDGYQAKDSALRANGRDVTLPDGKKLFAGSPVADAPYKDPGK